METGKLTSLYPNRMLGYDLQRVCRQIVRGRAHVAIQVTPMASKQSSADFVVDQLSPLGEITAKKMFGEFGLYCNGTFFGLICDDHCFIKPTEAGRQFIRDPLEAAPYPNAKPHFLVDDHLDNGPWMCDLVRTTTIALESNTLNAASQRPRRKK